MTWTEIANRLATIDPALTEQQRCVHEWKVIDRLFQGSVLRHRCSKCGYEAASDDVTPAPLVGDGNNEERFNSVDTLIVLCDDLGLGYRLERKSSTVEALTWKRENNPYFKHERAAEPVNGDPPEAAKQALATAILRAMEVGE